MYESIRDSVRKVRKLWACHERAARLRRLDPAARTAAREKLAHELGQAAGSLGDVPTFMYACDSAGALQAFVTVLQHSLKTEEVVSTGLLEDDVLVDACEMTSRSCIVVISCLAMPGIPDYQLNLGSTDELLAAAEVGSALERVLLDSLRAPNMLDTDEAEWVGTDEAEWLRAYGSAGHAELAAAWLRLIAASFSAVTAMADRFVDRLRAGEFAVAQCDATRISWKLSSLPFAMIHAGCLTPPIFDDILTMSNVALQLSSLAQWLNQTPDEAPSYGPVINSAALQADQLKKMVSKIVSATKS